MARDPWLSVIVPVYNGARYLRAALDSLLSETDGNTEVLVSDDGSTDDSPHIASEYAPRGIIALSGPRRRNWVTNSNYAAEKARGRFLAFLHQDDIWLPGRLRTMIALIESEPNRSLWLSPSYFIDRRGNRVGTWRLPFRRSKSVLTAAEFIERLLVQNFIAMPAPVFLRSSFERCGGMDESLWYTADWDLWLKLGSERGVAVTSVPTTAFRIHWESQTLAGAELHESMRAQGDTVRTRHLGTLTDPWMRASVDRAGRLCGELNASLAAAATGQSIDWRRLMSAFRKAGPDGCFRVARDARLAERVFARLRIADTGKP